MTAPNLELDGIRRAVRRGGTEVCLGVYPFRIVVLLAKSPLEHEALHERTYHDRDDGGASDDSFHATISALRRKLEPLGLRITQARWDRPYQLEVLP
jgi:DNA-binding response OmpR family regulator